MKLSEYDPAVGRKHLTIHAVFHCLSNLSHIGETVGNQANLRETKTIAPDGTPSSAFEYSGNALRNGLLRQGGMRSFFEALGVSVSPKIHQTFFSGGAIDGGTGNDLGFDSRIRTLCPLLSLLGTAKPAGVFGVKDALMVGGRASIGPGVLLCWETGLDIARAFPPALPVAVEADFVRLADLYGRLDKERALARVQRRASGAADILAEVEDLLRSRGEFMKKTLRPYRRWLTLASEYPRDSTQQPELAKYLKAAPVAELVGDAPKGKKPKKTNADGSKDTRNVLQDWLLARGATLYSRWDFHCTPLEEGAIADAMLQFAKSPYLGGKNRTGNGLVDCHLYWESEGDGGEWMQLVSGAERLSDRAAQEHARYRSYLEDYRQYLEDAAGSAELRALLEVG